ncbi:MAG: hypothetical protein ACFFDN_05145, partial [Candidatus Hodarchaeota archaeon]
MALRNRGKIPSRIDSNFVGRENILEELEQEWLKPLNESRFIFNIYGIGGIGKSKLLKQLLYNFASKEIFCELIADFDDLSDFLSLVKCILKKTRNGEEKVKFKNTEKLISSYEKLTNEAGKLGGDFPGQDSMLTLLELGGELSGIPGAGKAISTLGEKGLKKVASKMRENRDEALRKMRDSFKQELASTLVIDLNELCSNNKRFVLAIDTYEKVSKEVDEWLEYHFLYSCDQDIDFDIRIIIAGRQPLTKVNHRWEGEWSDYLYSLPLKSFSIDETRSFLKKIRNIDDSKLIKRIYTATQGYPLWLDMWTKSERDPESFFSVEHGQAMEERFIEMFPEFPEQDWLRKAAFFHRFDEDRLHVLIEEETGRAFSWLIQQSALIEGDRQYWKLHDIPRKILLTNLRTRSLTSFTEFATKISEYFEKQLEKPWPEWRRLELQLSLPVKDLNILSELSYYLALAHGDITEKHFDIMLRVSNKNSQVAVKLINHAIQALSDIEIHDVDAQVNSKITDARHLLTLFSEKVSEENWENMVSKVLNHRYTEYQKAILLEFIVIGYLGYSRVHQKALKYLDEIIGTFPEHFNALVLMSLVYQYEPKKSIKFIEKILERNPDFEFALVQKGR